MEIFLFPIVFIAYWVIYQIYDIQANQYARPPYGIRNSFQPKGTMMYRQTDDDYCMQTYKSCSEHSSKLNYQQIGNANIQRRGAIKQQICAHNVETGLNNFDSPCDIAYTNCKIRRPLFMSNQYQNATAARSKGTYFYNGQNHPCSYYIEATKTHAEAVQLYYASQK